MVISLMRVVSLYCERCAYTIKFVRYIPLTLLKTIWPAKRCIVVARETLNKNIRNFKVSYWCDKLEATASASKLL